MPQQFASVSYEPLMAAGRAFSQIPGQVAAGAEKYRQVAQIDKRNEQTYGDLIKMFDSSGIDYDREKLKPQPGEQNYDQRAKTEIAPLFGKMEEKGIDVRELIKNVSVPGATWEQFNMTLQKQKTKEKQQKITEAVRAAARPEYETEKKQMPAQEGKIPLTATYARQVWGAPQSEEAYLERVAQANMPENTTAEEIANVPDFKMKMGQYAAERETKKLAEGERQREWEKRYKIANEVYDKYRAYGHIFKDGVEKKDVGFAEILENPYVWTVQPGAAPPGSRGGGGGIDPKANLELKLQNAVIARLRQMNQSDFETNDPLTGLPLQVPRVKPNTYSARVLGNPDEYKRYAFQYLGNTAREVYGSPAPVVPSTQKGSGF